MAASAAVQHQPAGGAHKRRGDGRICGHRQRGDGQPGPVHTRKRELQVSRHTGCDHSPAIFVGATYGLNVLKLIFYSCILKFEFQSREILQYAPLVMNVAVGVLLCAKRPTVV